MAKKPVTKFLNLQFNTNGNPAVVSLARKVVTQLGYRILNAEILDREVQNIVLFDDGDCVFSPHTLCAWKQVQFLNDLYSEHTVHRATLSIDGQSRMAVHYSAGVVSYHKMPLGRKLLVGAIVVIDAVVRKVRDWVRG